MIEYSYIQEIDFSLPDELIKEVVSIGPVPLAGFGPIRMPLYKQINGLLFQKRFKPIRLRDKEKDEAVSVTASDLIKMAERLDVADPIWRNRITEFREMDLTGPIADKIIKCLPVELQALNPKVCLQTKGAGGYVTPPHRDHHRSCTLWCLLQGNDEQTVWWEKCTDFKEYDFWRFADPRCIKEVKRATLTKGTWYLFDNSSYHSVDTINEPVLDRTTLCIEFTNISAKTLFNKLLNHEQISYNNS